MKTKTLWLLVAALAATLALEMPPALALDVPDVPELRTATKFPAATARRKRRKRARRAARVQPLGGCFGTSVITEIDEAGGPIFPRSITPVTTESFLFTNSVKPLLGPTQASLRALVLGEDPPMISLAPVDLRNLVLEPGRGSVVGSGTVGGVPGLVRCTLPPDVACETIVPMPGRPIFDVQRVADDLFAVVTTDGLGSDVTRFISADGEETSILEPADFPGLFERSVVVRGDVAYVGGFYSPESRGIVIAVPLDGGEIREEVGFATGDFPGQLTLLGSDLVVEVNAHVSQNPADTSGSISSRLIRVQLDAAGVAIAGTEIAIDVPGFVNITDVEALDGQLFVVDSRLPTSFDGVAADGSRTSGRLLRICPL